MEKLTVDFIDWLGHASFRLRGSRTIYIDPWKIPGDMRDGDIVLVTHGHYDHLSMEDIGRIAKREATVVIPATIERKVSWPKVVTVAPGQTVTVEGIRIEAVAAYNIDKHFHPRVEQWVGYVVDLDGIKVYHTGDTDLIDEFRTVRCDIVLLPVSGTYVMNAREAVEAVKILQPKIAIPMHYGDIVGDKKDALYFQESSPCEVVIKEPVG